MIAAPTFSQIRAQVDAILARSPHSKVIGIHAQGRWTGDRQQQKGDRHYLIDQCDSPLEIRLALQSVDNAQTVRVIITPLSDQDLEEDICLRLAKQRLFSISPWQVVKSLFNATNIDPRLTQYDWLPAALIESIPDRGYTPALGGFLDAEIVWPILLRHSIHLRYERPDLPALLSWSASADNIKRYQQTSEPFRAAAVEWLTNLSGPATPIVLHCIAHNRLPEALPLGLAAQVVYHPKAQGKLDKAIGKLEERFLAGLAPKPEMMQLWTKAARQSLSQLPTELQQARIRRSDEILSEIGADRFARFSTVSEQGFDQQLTELAKQLETLVKKPTQVHLNKLTAAYHAVSVHQQSAAEKNQRRLQRVDMALRLSQWLANASTIAEPPSLQDAIAYHTTEGSFLDWARLTLPISEPNQTLSAAYGSLFEAVTAIREKQAYQFATFLKDWTETGSTQKNVLPIEQILETVVAPLAAKTRVLLIVMDGMSMAVCHELLSHLKTQFWQLIQATTQTEPIRAALAALPSETVASRTSLLCGQLQRGNAHTESKAFANQPELLKHCKKKFPPILFHKAALQSTDNNSLSQALVAATSSEKQPIVALVINAIDDLLSKGDQVDTEWTFESIKLLQPVLQTALDNNLSVVLTSDHGHVLEYGAQYKKTADSGERWRDDDGNPESQEIQIKGSRVLTETQSLIAPWSEKLRYTQRKNGYHGGLNPQEMLVPIAVLSPLGTHPPGWQPTTDTMPPWWEKPNATSSKFVRLDA